MTSKMPCATIPLSSSDGNFSSSLPEAAPSALSCLLGTIDLTATSLPSALSFSSSRSIASTRSAFFIVEVPLIPLVLAISFKSASANDSYFSLIHSSCTFALYFDAEYSALNSLFFHSLVFIGIINT